MSKKYWEAQEKPSYQASIEENNTNNGFPAFSFTYLDKDFSFKHCTNEEKDALLKRLEIMSKMTWNDIINTPKHGNGIENINELKDKLPPKWKGTTPKAFRFYGMKPVIGVRDGRIFHIIWIDREGKLYKH